MNGRKVLALIACVGEIAKSLDVPANACLDAIETYRARCKKIDAENPDKEEEEEEEEEGISPYQDISDKQEQDEVAKLNDFLEKAKQTFFSANNNQQFEGNEGRSL